MKALTCHTDKNSRLANVLGWKRREGERSRGGGHGGCSGQRVHHHKTQPEGLAFVWSVGQTSAWPCFPLVLGSQRGAGLGKSPRTRPPV